MTSTSLWHASLIVGGISISIITFWLHYKYLRQQCDRVVIGGHSKTTQPVNCSKYSCLIISGPSGVGKDTMINFLFTKFPNKFIKAVPHTTRALRKDEVNGIDYHFIQRSMFVQMSDSNQFLIEKQAFNQFYGLSKSEVKHKVFNNDRKILKLDVYKL